MKFLTSLIYLAILSISTLFAQDFQSNNSSYIHYEGIPSKEFDGIYKKSGTSKSKGGSYTSSKNSIKIGGLEAFFGRPGVFYERVLAPWISVELGVGINFKSSLLGNSYNGNFFRNQEVSNLYSFDRGIGYQWSILPKIYTGKSAQKGFYIALGVQQSVLNIKGEIYKQFSDPDIYKVKSKEFGVGGGLGAQMFVSNIILDYNVLFFYNTINQNPLNSKSQSYNLKGNALQITYSVKIGGFWGGGKSKK